MFRSGEASATLRKEKFLRPDKRGHTWHRTLRVDVNRRRGCVVRAFLLPAVRCAEAGEQAGGGGARAILLVCAELKSGLLARLRRCGEDCWVLVEAEVRDRRAGKKYGFAEVRPYALAVGEEREGAGQVSFCQELVRCEELEACRCERVELVMKFTLVVCRRCDYEVREDDQGFCVVTHK